MQTQNVTSITNAAVKPSVFGDLPKIAAKMVPVQDIFGDAYEDFNVLQFLNTETVPQLQVYLPDPSVFETVLRWWSAKPVAPIGLHGPTGSGKTEMFQHLAASLGLPFFKLQCHEDIRAENLFTKDDLVVNNGASETVTAPTDLLKAYVSGGLIVLDEFDKLNSDCTAALHALTEYKPVSTSIGSFAPHKFTKVIGTSNTVGDGTSSDYTSSAQLDMAFRSRFNWLELDYPSEENEIAIMVMKYPRLEVELIKQLVKVGITCRLAKKNGGVTLPFSTRTLTAWGNNISILGRKASLLDSFKFTYANGLEESERESGIDCLESIFGVDDMTLSIEDYLKKA